MCVDGGEKTGHVDGEEGGSHFARVVSTCFNIPAEAAQKRV